MITLKIRLYKDSSGALRIDWLDGLNCVSQNSVGNHVVQFVPDGFELAHGEHIRMSFATSLNEADVNTENVGWTYVPLDWLTQTYKAEIPPLVLATRGTWYVQAQIAYGNVHTNQYLNANNSVNTLSFEVNNSIYEDATGNYPNDADIANLYRQAKDGIEYLKGNVTIVQLNAELGALIEFKNLEKGVEIDWGDGYRDFTIVDNQTVGHTYETAGNYTCRLYNLTKVGENGFCSKYITRVVLADTISAVGYAAFLGDTALREVVLPNNLKVLGLKCFELCTSLKSIVLPENVINIGGNVFEQCANLRYVYMRSVVPPNLSASLGFVSNELTIIVPRESLEAYKTARTWSDYADKIDAVGFQGELMQGIPGLNALVYETIVSCVTKEGNVVMYDLNGFNRTPLAGDCFTALLESSENSSVYAASLEVTSIRPADGKVDAVIKKLSWIRGGIEIVRLY